MSSQRMWSYAVWRLIYDSRQDRLKRVRLEAERLAKLGKNHKKLRRGCNHRENDEQLDYKSVYKMSLENVVPHWGCWRRKGKPQRWHY